MLSSDKEFYENLSKKELSEQEVFEAKHNFVGFFDLLYCIDKMNYGKVMNNDETIATESIHPRYIKRTRNLCYGKSNFNRA